MNEHVVRGLNKYVEDTDPQFAVLLKGDWGCGKTFFVKEWLNSLPKESEGLVLTPIYVSLFGVSSIHALTEKINRTLSPLMYKVEKYGKALIKLAGKVILKYDGAIADFQNAQLEYELNPIDLLKLNIEDDGANDKPKTKYVLFVFDDIERCTIAPEELMGYFDHLLEQLGCRVVIVKGNDSQQEDHWRTVMAKYQEKLIGREYEVDPNVQSAILKFSSELKTTHPKTSQYYEDNIELLILIFKTSKYCNLRSLRHSIRSFAEVYENLECGADDFELRLMIQYMVFSLEYLNGDKDLLLSLSNISLCYSGFRNDSPEKPLMDKYIPIQQKYQKKSF